MRLTKRFKIILPPVCAWHRRPSETDAQWVAFERFRDLPPERSIVDLATQLGGDADVLARWAADHAWACRVAEWDKYQLFKAMTDRLAEQSAESRRQLAEAKAMLDPSPPTTPTKKLTRTERQIERHRVRGEKALTKCHKLLARCHIDRPES